MGDCAPNVLRAESISTPYGVIQHMYGVLCTGFLARRLEMQQWSVCWPLDVMAPWSTEYSVPYCTWYPSQMLGLIICWGYSLLLRQLLEGTVSIVSAADVYHAT